MSNHSVPHSGAPHALPDADGSGQARVPLLRMAPTRVGEPAPLVLIAEDHLDSRDALQTLLEALGYRVRVAGDGAEAVQVARAEQPDLILMDMMMPGVDGFAATRTLRADPAFDAVPIVAITALEGSRPSVIEAGCDDCVLKPIDIRAFMEKLHGWLGARRPAS